MLAIGQVRGDEELDTAAFLNVGQTLGLAGYHSIEGELDALASFV